MKTLKTIVALACLTGIQAISANSYAQENLERLYEKCKKSNSLITFITAKPKAAGKGSQLRLISDQRQGDPEDLGKVFIWNDAVENVLEKLVIDDDAVIREIEKAFDKDRSKAAMISMYKNKEGDTYGQFFTFHPDDGTRVTYGYTKHSSGNADFTYSVGPKVGKITIGGGGMVVPKGADKPKYIVSKGGMLTINDQQVTVEDARAMGIDVEEGDISEYTPKINAIKGFEAKITDAPNPRITIPKGSKIAIGDKKVTAEQARAMGYDIVEED